MLVRIIILFVLSCSFGIAAPININEATAEKIAKSLQGIGPSKAAAIVQFRDENGPFKSVEELKYVKGIGNKTIEKNRNEIIIVVDNQ